MRGLFCYSQSMPKITSDVRSGNTRTCCSITTGCSEIPPGISKRRKDRETLSTKLPFAKVTDSFDAGVSFKPPVAATQLCTKLCVAPLSTKHSNRCPCTKQQIKATEVHFHQQCLISWLYSHFYEHWGWPCQSTLDTGGGLACQKNGASDYRYQVTT